MYVEVKLIEKMAAAVRQIGRWRPIFNGPIFLQTRTATKRQRQLEEHKRNDDVFLLNYRTPPSHTFTDAMSALRAYAINGERQTVELQMKINMGENKVNHSCDKSLLLVMILIKGNLLFSTDQGQPFSWYDGASKTIWKRKEVASFCKGTS